jgi:serine/threonine protein kinase
MEKDGPHYAVKILAKASLAPENIKRKLFAEINIHRVLKHDYIVQFDSVFEDRNNVYMLMEMCHNKVNENNNFKIRIITYLILIL